jgi:hypothetical protein
MLPVFAHASLVIVLWLGGDEPRPYIGLLRTRTTNAFFVGATLVVARCDAMTTFSSATWFLEMGKQKA